MKIEEAIKQYCNIWKHSPCVIKTDKCGYWNINIQFIDNDGSEDETQMDIKPAYFDYGAGKCPRLVELWKEFCADNGIRQNAVVGIAIVSTV